MARRVAATLVIAHDVCMATTHARQLADMICLGDRPTVAGLSWNTRHENSGSGAGRV